MAIIPARGGSKGIPKKNIIDLGGFPLIAYSIAAAKLSSKIGRVVVSTDSREIADIAKKYGAEVPFLRPAALASDKSPDMEFVIHALDWFKEHEQFEPQYLVHLRPTTPLRDPFLVDKAIEELMASKKATCLRSAHELSESPYKFFVIKEGFFAGLFDNDNHPDYHNLPRQAFPAGYHPNGYVDVLKTSVVRNLGVMHGQHILPFITEYAIEVDKPDDLNYLRFDAGRKEYAIVEYLKKHAKIN